jgi:hypothetical protein
LQTLLDESRFPAQLSEVPFTRGLWETNGSFQLVQAVVLTLLSGSYKSFAAQMLETGHSFFHSSALLAQSNPELHPSKLLLSSTLVKSMNVARFL